MEVIYYGRNKRKKNGSYPLQSVGAYEKNIQVCNGLQVQNGGDQVMMEYAKTAKQTAKKNGINFINNKLIADFSAVKTMIHNNIEDINNIDRLDISAENIYNTFVEVITNDLNKYAIPFDNSSYTTFYINDIKFFIDIINTRTAVYNDGLRKYGVITADAARLTAYKNNTVILQFDYNVGKFKNDYSPIFTVDIA